MAELWGPCCAPGKEPPPRASREGPNAGTWGLEGGLPLSKPTLKPPQAFLLLRAGRP